MNREKIDLVIKARELLEKQGRLPNGRKSRSDKGKSRPSYKTSSKSAWWKYRMVLSKLVAKDIDNNLVSYDENGYYVDIDVQYTPEYGQFVNNSIIRSVKYKRTQIFISLEKYRFEAYQELAIKYPDKLVVLPNRDLTRWALECGHLSPEDANLFFAKKKYTYKTFFAEFYHVLPEEIPFYTYVIWRNKYDKVPGGIELDNNFTFKISESVEETHLEWAWYTEDKKQEEALLAEQDKIVRSQRASLAQFNRKMNKENK